MQCFADPPSHRLSLPAAQQGPPNGEPRLLSFRVSTGVPVDRHAGAPHPSSPPAGVAAVKAACHGGSPAVEPAGPRAGPPPGPVCREASLDSDHSDGTAYATPPESADGLLDPEPAQHPLHCTPPALLFQMSLARQGGGFGNTLVGGQRGERGQKRGGVDPPTVPSG